jgi:tetratricopeptide (TPR) repeat protein
MIDKEELLKDQPWIESVAENIATLVVDDQICKHPELSSQFNHLFVQHKLELMKIIQEDYLELVEDMEGVQNSIKERVDLMPPTQKEALLLDFKKAYDYFSSDKPLENLKLNDEDEKGLWQLIGLSPTTIAEFYTIGLFYLDNREPLRAKGIFKLLTFIAPEFVDLWISLGVCFLDLDKTLEAQKTFELAVSLEPENPKPLFYLAYSESLLKNRETALALCEQIESLLKDESDHKELLENTLELKKSIKK